MLHSNSETLAVILERWIAQCRILPWFFYFHDLQLWTLLHAKFVQRLPSISSDQLEDSGSIRALSTHYRAWGQRLMRRGDLGTLIRQSAPIQVSRYCEFGWHWHLHPFLAVNASGCRQISFWFFLHQLFIGRIERILRQSVRLRQINVIRLLRLN